VHTALGKLVVSIFRYSEGTLLVELRTICAGVKNLQLSSAKQQYQSIPHHHFFRTAALIN
jgi:hypothetical protein